MRIAVAAILLVLFAGCAENVEPETSDEPLNEVDEPVLIADEPELATSNVTANPLVGLTAFHWATDAKLGNAALAITIDFGSTNECELSHGVTGTTDGSGTRAVMISDNGWSASGSGLARVAAGPVDTETLLGGDGSYGSASFSRGSFSGTQTFTRVALGIEPVQSDFLQGQSLTMSATCGKPFEVLGAKIGQEAWVGDEYDFQTGVSVVLAGSAGSGTAMLEVTRGQGHVRFGSFGAHAGQVSLQSPEGEADFTLPLDEDGGLIGGPGLYSVSTTRAGAYLEAYWHVMYNLADAIDLSAGMRETPAYESPF